MGRAGVEAGRDLEAALVIQIVEELEAALQPGPGGLHRAGETAAGDTGQPRGSAPRRSARAARCRAPKRKSCSTRTCGSHSHRLPAPVSGETPTCASELGSRGLKIGFSSPTMMLRVFQSISIEPVRSRIARSWWRPAEEIHVDRAVDVAAPDGAGPADTPGR